MRFLQPRYLIYPYEGRDESHDVSHCVYDAHHGAGEIGRNVQHGGLLPAAKVSTIVSLICQKQSISCGTASINLLAT